MINLHESIDLSTVYVGGIGLKRVMEQNLAVPLALASADFDEDGVPDFVSGYAGPSGGIVTLYRGAEARVVATPDVPEFLGAGDFNADGHEDVVVAARGSNALHLLPGTGRGGFDSPQPIELPGQVTTMLTGEINRRDGLDDVIVGIVGPDGPQVLVFESPQGALPGKPEVIAIPAEATALALGQLDESFETDLAIAASNELLLVHGRDRRLSIADSLNLNPHIERRAFPYAIRSLALGDFINDKAHQTDIALLAHVAVTAVRNNQRGGRLYIDGELVKITAGPTADMGVTFNPTQAATTASAI